MPATKTGIIWKCKQCQLFTVSTTDVALPSIKEQAFQHWVANHGLVESNRQWFSNHFKTYYDIT